MFSFVSILAIIGGFCFAYCGVPAAISTIRKGRSIGIPISTAWMISLGGIVMYLYLFLKHGFDIFLTINYSIEVLSWLTIVWFHYCPITKARD